MDKTVRLWHISRRECLCCFQHIDFVTAIAFHPRVSRVTLHDFSQHKLYVYSFWLTDCIYSNICFFSHKDDRYFLSGSLDGKLRLWNIPDKKVALWNEVDGQTRLITAANFCQNGKYAVIGTYDGRCIFYDTEVTDWATSADTCFFNYVLTIYRFNQMYYYCLSFCSAWNTTLKSMWGPREAGTKLDAKSLALNLFLERTR